MKLLNSDQIETTIGNGKFVLWNGDGDSAAVAGAAAARHVDFSSSFNALPSPRASHAVHIVSPIPLPPSVPAPQTRTEDSRTWEVGSRAQRNLGGLFNMTETFLSPPFESIPVAEAVLRSVFVQLRAPPPLPIPTPLSLLPRNASVVQFCLTLCRSVLSDAGLFDSVGRCVVRFRLMLRRSIVSDAVSFDFTCCCVIRLCMMLCRSILSDALCYSILSDAVSATATWLGSGYQGRRN